MTWVWEKVTGAVEKVADFILDEIVEPVLNAVGNVIDAVLDDPIKTIAQIAALVTPGMQWALPLIEAADVVIAGGDLGDALKAAAVSYVSTTVGAQVGSVAGKAVGDAVGSATVGKLVEGGVKSAVGAVVTGRDPIQAFITGGASAAIPAALGSIPEFSTFKDSNPYAAAAISSGITAKLTGGNVTNAVIAGMVQAGTLVKGIIEKAKKDGIISTPAQEAVASQLITNTTIAALTKGNVSAAIQSSLFNAGVNALANMFTSDFKSDADKISTKTDAAKVLADKVDANVAAQNEWADKHNALKNEWDVKVAVQDDLKAAYDKALETYNADKTQANADAVNKATANFNAYVEKLNEEYTNDYKPKFDTYTAELKKLQDAYPTLAKDYSAADAAVKDSMDKLAGSVDDAAVVANKEFTKALDPNFDAAAYRKLNGLDSEVDVYEHYLSTGMYSGATTNYDSFLNKAFSALPEYDAAYYSDEYNAAKAAISSSTTNASNIDSVIQKYVDQVDRDYTTADEAKAYLKEAYTLMGDPNHQVTDAEVSKLTGQNEINAYTLAQYNTSLGATTYDGSSAPSKQAAMTSAKDAGYNNFIYDGQVYTFTTPKNLAEVNFAIEAQNLSFSNAFALARKELGAGQTFTWQGKEYTTNLAPTLAKDTFDASKAADNTAAAILAAANGKTKFLAPDGKLYSMPKQAFDYYQNASNTSPAETRRLMEGVIANISNETPESQPAQTPTWADDAKKISDRVGKSIKDIFYAGSNQGMGSFLTGIGNFASMMAVTTDLETGEVTWNIPKDNILTKWGAAYTAIGDAALSETTKQQKKEIGAAVAAAPDPLTKFLVAVGGGMTNPVAFANWAFAEATEEAPGLLMGFGLVKGLKVAVEGGVALTVGLDAAEIAGQVSMETYDKAIKAGKTEAEAVQDMLKTGTGAIALSLVTTGMLDATIFKNLVSATTQPIISTAASTGAKSVMAEWSEEAATSMWAGYIQNGEKLTQGVIDNAFNQASIASLIGAHVNVGLDLSPTIAANAVQIGYDIAGNAMTYADLVAGNKLLDATTLNLNAVIGKTSEGNDITLGGYVTEASQAIDPTLYTNNVAPSVRNKDFNVGVDALGNTVTYSQLQQQAYTQNTSYETAYTGLISTTNSDRVAAQTDFLQTTLKNLGYTATAAEVKTLQEAGGAKIAANIPSETDIRNALRVVVGSSNYDIKYDWNGDGKVDLQDVQNLQNFSRGQNTSVAMASGLPWSQATSTGTASLIKAATDYADVHTITFDESKKLLTSAFEAQGFKGIVPTDEQVNQFVQSGASVDPTAVQNQINTWANQNTTTYEEAKALFKDTYGYTPSYAEINQFVKVVSEEQSRADIGAYVNPRQVTTEEARKYLTDLGYNPTDAEVARFVGQVNEAEQATKIGEYVEPRMVDEQEVRDAYAALGLAKPTQEDVLALVGQYSESELTGRAETNLSGARYNSIIAQLNELAVGASPEALDAIALVKKDLNAQIVALGGDIEALSGDVATAKAELLGAIKEAQAGNTERFGDIDKAIQDLKDAGLSEQQVQDIVDKSTAGLSTDFKAALDEAVKGNSEALTKVQEDLTAKIGDVQTALETALGDQTDAFNTKVQELMDQGKTYQEATEEALSDLGIKIDDLGADFATKLKDAQDALGEQITGLGEQLTDIEKNLLDKIAANEEAGLSRDEATQKAVADLAADLGTTKESLLEQLGTTEENLTSRVDTLEETLTKQVTDIEAAIYDKMAEYEKAGIERNEALAKAVADVAADLGTTKEDLLKQLSTTEETLTKRVDDVESNLGTKITDAKDDVLAELEKATAALSTDITGVQETLQKQLEDSEKNILDRAAEYEAAGIERDEALGKAIADVSAELGTTKEDLLTALGTTEQNLALQITGVEETLTRDIQTKYDSLTEGQKALADQLIQQGVDLNTAIETAKSQMQTALGETETRLTGEIQTVADILGKPAQQVTQADIDLVADIIAAQQADPTLGLTTEQKAYDINRDGVIDNIDMGILDSVMRGTIEPGWVAPAGTVWAPTGMFRTQAEDTAATQKAIADAAAAAAADAERTRQAQAASALRTQQMGNVNTMLGMLMQAPDIRGQTVTTKQVDPTKIGYVYDWSSIFANPQQQQMFASPYGGYARGGAVRSKLDETNEELLKLLGG